MQEAPVHRGVEIATAIMLGVVSVVTAFGALQATLWGAEADRLGILAADARDQSIAIGVSAQIQQRSDMRSILTAAFIAIDQDEAIAAGDEVLAIQLGADLTTQLGNILDLPEGAFDAWREAEFPDDGNPLDGPLYLVEQGRGDVDALTLASQRLSEIKSGLSAKSELFGQAALVHALALFLFGVAGINRLRVARYVTLVGGAAVCLIGLALMALAY